MLMYWHHFQPQLTAMYALPLLCCTLIGAPIGLTLVLILRRWSII
jgi:hypothetical protein